MADIVQRNANTGMDQIPIGKAEAIALGLLMSATLRQDYDIVLLGTPPAEVITDARIVTGLADGTLFCILWRKTRQHAHHMRSNSANVVGVALTQVDANVHVRSGYADAVVYYLHDGDEFRE